MAVYFTAAEFFLSKLQFIDVIARLILVVTAQWGAEVVILFAVALNDPQAKGCAF